MARCKRGRRPRRLLLPALTRSSEKAEAEARGQRSRQRFMACVMIFALAAVASAVEISERWSQLPNGFGVLPLSAADRARIGEMPRAFTRDESSGTKIPASFDAREHWPGCIGPVLDQGTCGACWAVSAVSAMSDRLCIERRDVKGDVNATFEQLSALQVVACDKGPFEPGGNKGCQGGQPYAAMDYAEKKGGLVPEKCFPYLKSDGGSIDTCAYPRGLAPGWEAHTRALASCHRRLHSCHSCHVCVPCVLVHVSVRARVRVSGRPARGHRSAVSPTLSHSLISLI